MTSPVAIVVVTWNGRDEIEACLASAFADSPAEVVVVDNGSHDGTPEFVAERFPRATLVRQARNTGFAAGCNAGVAASRAPYVLFLNSDAKLLPGYLSTLVAALEQDEKLASATGKLFYEDNGQRYIDSAGIDLCAYALRPLDRGFGEVDRGQYDEREYIFGPSGAAALYRRSALERVGPQAFDEVLFAYYEDVDLAWRLNNLGFRHLYEPRALAMHRRRGAGGKPSAIKRRAFFNRYRVWWRNESLMRFLMYAPVAVPWEMARLVRYGIAAVRSRG